MRILSKIRNYFFRYRNSDTGEFITREEYLALPEAERMKHKIRAR